MKKLYLLFIISVVYVQDSVAQENLLSKEEAVVTTLENNFNIIVAKNI